MAISKGEINVYPCDNRCGRLNAKAIEIQMERFHLSDGRVFMRHRDDLERERHADAAAEWTSTLSVYAPMQSS